MHNGLSNIKKLILNFDKVKAIYFEGLDNLIELKFYGSICEIEQNAFAILPNLEILNIERSNIEIIDENFFESSPYILKELYLAYNCVTSLDIFRSLKNLKVLDLYQVKVDKITEQPFVGLVNLTVLNLSEVNIEYPPPSLLSVERSRVRHMPRPHLGCR